MNKTAGSEIKRSNLVDKTLITCYKGKSGRSSTGKGDYRKSPPTNRLITTASGFLSHFPQIIMKFIILLSLLAKKKTCISLEGVLRHTVNALVTPSKEWKRKKRREGVLALTIFIRDWSKVTATNSLALFAWRFPVRLTDW